MIWNGLTKKLALFVGLVIAFWFIVPFLISLDNPILIYFSFLTALTTISLKAYGISFTKKPKIYLTLFLILFMADLAQPEYIIEKEVQSPISDSLKISADYVVYSILGDLPQPIKYIIVYPVLIFMLYLFIKFLKPKDSKGGPIV